MLSRRPTAIRCPRRLLILGVLVSSLANAQAVYKWQDDDGRWHYADRPPPGQTPFEALAMPYMPRSRVSERRAGTERRPRHFFHNHLHGPAELELRLTEAKNVTTQPELPARFVLPADAERGLLTVSATDAKAAFSYRVSYLTVPGRPMDRLPEQLTFYPPFARDSSFPISQGLDDTHTHNDAANRYAIDFGMPIGTPVLAARGGVVMDAMQRFPDLGRVDPALASKANFVRILHDDGSMAVYAHLQRNSLRVRPGMRIPEGYWLANSGNSGYSSGPHLHFVVQINIGMALESLPLRFYLPDGGSMDPDRPQRLRGVLAARQ